VAAPKKSPYLSHAKRFLDSLCRAWTIVIPAPRVMRILRLSTPQFRFFSKLPQQRLAQRVLRFCELLSSSNVIQGIELNNCHKMSDSTAPMPKTADLDVAGPGVSALKRNS
jgi:hypothetical protein